MKNKFLLPESFKKFGWLIFVVATSVFLGYLMYDWEPSFLAYTYYSSKMQLNISGNLILEVIFTFWMVGLILIAFSKEKYEDEFIAHLRLTRWQYSIFASLVISIIGTWTIYGGEYLIFSALNMLTAPLVFIVIFNIAIYRISKRNSADEE